MAPSSISESSLDDSDALDDEESLEVDVDALSLELLVDELLESLALATLELELDALDVSLDDELAEEGISSLELSSVDESLEGVD